MACNHCEEFTRSHLVRQAVAEAGRGLPRDRARDAGCRPGTGLSRRSFLLRSSAAMLSVYGASKLRLGDARGGDRPGGGRQRPGPGLDLPRRRHRLALGARRRPPTRSTARLRPNLALPADAGTAFTEDPRLRWNPAAAALAALHAAGKMRVLPGGRLLEPRPVALHLAPLLGGRRAAAERGQRLDGPAARPDRHPRQPAPGPVARRLALAGARQPLGAGGGDRRPLLRPLGRGRLGRARDR